MKLIATTLFFALCFTWGVERGEAASAEQKCPVVIDHVELLYNHAGGHSIPQLKVSFDNAVRKRISTVTFNLRLLGASGDERPYPDDLKYSDGVEMGKNKVFTWDLTPQEVDIHRLGETVMVQRVEFDDGPAWVDDGSESCVFKVDFQAK
jgi:hypothetical protein